MSFNERGMVVVIPYEIVEMVRVARDDFKPLDKNTGLRLAESQRLQNEVGELVTAIIMKHLGTPLLLSK